MAGALNLSPPVAYGSEGKTPSSFSSSLQDTTKLTEIVSTKNLEMAPSLDLYLTLVTPS